MIDNNIENKLRKFNEDIRPESQQPFFVETLSTLVYVGRVKCPSLTSIFCSLLSTRLPCLEEHNTKRVQALRTFFTQSEIDYLHELIFQAGAEWQEFSNR